jgi:hypothetical protein
MRGLRPLQLLALAFLALIFFGPGGPFHPKGPDSD